MARTVRLGDRVVDLVLGEVQVDDDLVALTNRERELLDYLVRHVGSLVSRDELLQAVWRVDEPSLTRSVDLAVARLRKKIEADPRRPRFLHTVRGEGYRFDLEATTPQEGQGPIDRVAPPVLLGRDADLARLRGALAPGRAVVLVGPPGVGKTALAGAAVTEPDALAVDLTGVTTLGAALERVAARLGLRVPPSERATAIRGVARGRTVFLDNADTVAETPGLAMWVDDLAAVATVLVTSRVRLVGRGETIEVAPLPRPAAVALLAQRSGRDPDRLDAVCAAADDLPLAIELLAPWVRRLGPAAVLDRIDRLRDRPGPEGVSLHGAVATSVEALDPTSRRALRMLAFPTGAMSPDYVDDLLLTVTDDPLAALAVLLDAHLLQREPGPDGVRFRMLDTVRSFARHLLPDEELAVGFAHAVTTRVNAVKFRSETVEGASVREVVDLWPDLKAAVDILEAGDPPGAAKALLLLSQLIGFVGHQSEHRGFAERAVALADAGGSPLLRSRVANNLAVLCAWDGQVSETMVWARRALELAQDLDDPLALGNAWRMVAWAGARQGRSRQEVEHAYGEAIAAAARAERPAAVAVLHAHRALFLTSHDLDAARRDALVAHRGLEAAGNRNYTEAARYLTTIEWLAGRPEAARSWAALSVARGRDIGGRLHGRSLNNLACALVELGIHDEAVAAVDDADAIATTADDAGLAGQVANTRALVELDRGELEAAVTAWDRCIALGAAIAPSQAADGYLGRAMVAILRGHLDLAADQLDAAHRALEPLEPLPNRTARLHLLRGVLARAHGRPVDTGPARQALRVTGHPGLIDAIDVVEDWPAYRGDDALRARSWDLRRFVELMSAVLPLDPP